LEVIRLRPELAGLRRDKEDREPAYAQGYGAASRDQKRSNERHLLEACRVAKLLRGAAMLRRFSTLNAQRSTLNASACFGFNY